MARYEVRIRTEVAGNEVNPSPKAEAAITAAIKEHKANGSIVEDYCSDKSYTLCFEDGAQARSFMRKCDICISQPVDFVDNDEYC